MDETANKTPTSNNIDWLRKQMYKALGVPYNPSSKRNNLRKPPPPDVFNIGSVGGASDNHIGLALGMPGSLGGTDPTVAKASAAQMWSQFQEQFPDLSQHVLATLAHQQQVIHEKEREVELLKQHAKHLEDHQNRLKGSYSIPRWEPQLVRNAYSSHLGNPPRLPAFPAPSSTTTHVPGHPMNYQGQQQQQYGTTTPVPSQATGENAVESLMQLMVQQQEPLDQLNTLLALLQPTHERRETLATSQQRSSTDHLTALLSIVHQQQQQQQQQQPQPQGQQIVQEPENPGGGFLPYKRRLTEIDGSQNGKDQSVDQS